jgi:formylglycine-generating enzyme required for sulfatase activity
MSKTKEQKYQADFEQVTHNLSDKEKSLFLPRTNLISPEQAIEMKEKLLAMDFVRCEGGKVLMGQDQGLPCSIEGQRVNETPQREYEIPPFYIAKNTVTNADFEKFDPRHTRTNTSLGDKNPVTCTTYGRAIGYTLWINEQTGMNFNLPTEPQWVSAIAPYGWQYSHKPDGRPSRKSQNTYKSFPDSYPSQETGATLEVDDPQVEPNRLGIHHATGNVSVYTLGHYQTKGSWGSISNGSYSVVVGGNFRLCPFGSRTLTRGILDVTAIVDTVGIRLVHPDPEHTIWLPLLDSFRNQEIEFDYTLEELKIFYSTMSNPNQYLHKTVS